MVLSYASKNFLHKRKFYFSDLDPWKSWRCLMITSWYSKLVVLATICSFISSFKILIGGISSWENVNIFFIFNNINRKIFLIIIFWYIIGLNVRWITHPKENYINHCCMHDLFWLLLGNKNIHERSHHHLNHVVLEDLRHRQNWLWYLHSHFK